MFSIEEKLTELTHSLLVKVPYLPASRAQVRNVMTLLHGRSGGMADLGSGDGRIVSICYLVCMH